MKNVKDLRDSLIKKYIEFSNSEEKNPTELSSLTACASAIIRTAKVELDYKKHTKDNSAIPFLNTKIKRTSKTNKK